MMQRQNSSGKSFNSQEILKMQINQLFRTRIFGILLILFQILMAVCYGFFIRFRGGLNQTQISGPTAYVMMVLQFFLIVIGFGFLIASAGKKLSYSAVGFTILMVSISLQLYFLMNAFWSKVGIQSSDFTDFHLGITYEIRFSFFQSWNAKQFWGNNLTQALKCSLCNLVVLSMIIGRVGPLQVFATSVGVTIVYQLARQINVNFNETDFGSMKTFLFGGSFGLGISIMLKIYQKQKTKFLENVHISKQIGAIGLMGLLIVWIIFPILAYESRLESSLILVQPLPIIFALAASTLVSFFISFFYFGMEILLLGTIAGGVSALSAAPYILNPAYGIVIGSVAAIIQFFFIFIHRFLKKKYGLIDSFGSFVFLSAGCVGAIWATVFQAAIASNVPANVYYNNAILLSSRPVLHFANGWVSLTIGFAGGLTLGVFFYCFSILQSQQYFDDATYWKQIQEKPKSIIRKDLNFSRVVGEIAKNASEILGSPAKGLPNSQRPSQIRLFGKEDIPRRQKNQQRIQAKFISGSNDIKNTHSYL